MKSSFPGYYRPTADEFSELWDKALFALDANVLLNIYGYSTPTRNTLLTLLEKIGERLWIPHQFASEYQRNRARAILDQVGHYVAVRQELEAVLNQHFRAKHKHPYIRKSSQTAFESICQELAKGQTEHERLLTEDPYFSKVSKLLEGRVGPPSSDEQMAAICTTARERYAKRIPPGYADDKKQEPDRFGDYIGWRQILDYGAEKKAAVILVTDDRKEDWWQTERDRIIGPRPELVAEYQILCKQPFYMYSLEQFMRRAKEYLGTPVAPAVIEEVRERTQAQTTLGGEKEDPKLEASGVPIDSSSPERDTKRSEPGASEKSE